jgi:RNA polymerase sigma-70 factor (ECF subfamily)
MMVSIAVTTSADRTPTHADRRARLDTLFTSHAAAVFGFARRRTSRAEAEDVVSETFLVAWRRIDEVPEHALPWLLGTARRVLANRRRADSRQTALRGRMGCADRGESAPTEPPQPQVATVLAALALLPAAERDAITLLAWEGLTPDEAATVLGCSRATFYVRVHRARRRLIGRVGPLAELTNTKEVE